MSSAKPLNVNKISSKQKRAIKKMILAEAKDGRIKCGKARDIAKSLGLPIDSVGSIADQLQIRISKCELGCF